MMASATKLIQLFIIGFFFNSAITNADKQVPKIDEEICVKGYIMDTYCIDLGVLLDNRLTPTLSAEGPLKHSVHCLIDVPHCRNSPYEVLNELDNGEFGRSWRLDSNDMIIAHVKKIGGCGDCDQSSGTEGAISKGLQLALNATVVNMGDSKTPPTIKVTAIHAVGDFDSICNSGVKFTPPNGMITDSGSLLVPILIHGSLMIIGWGFLLPSGVVIAALGKHRSNSWWFKVHRVIQPVGLLVAIVAWLIALRNFSALDASGDGTLSFPHALLGMITMVIGLIQPMNAIFRPHLPKYAEEPKSTLRVVWEICHKVLGYLVIILVFATISLGTAIAPNEYKLNFQIGYFAVCLGLLVLLVIALLVEKKKYAGHQASPKSSTHV